MSARLPICTVQDTSELMVRPALLSAGVRPSLRVVPLFETLDDLNNATGTIRTLLSNDWYRAHINGLQECMIGKLFLHAIESSTRSQREMREGTRLSLQAYMSRVDCFTRIRRQAYVHYTVYGVFRRGLRRGCLCGVHIIFCLPMCVRAGYSDSGKDAGRMAAAWALFETQEKLVAVANEYGVKLVLFHGRCVKLKAVNFV